MQVMTTKKCLPIFKNRLVSMSVWIAMKKQSNPSHSSLLPLLYSFLLYSSLLFLSYSRRHLLSLIISISNIIIIIIIIIINIVIIITTIIMIIIIIVTSSSLDCKSHKRNCTRNLPYDFYFFFVLYCKFRQ